MEEASGQSPLLGRGRVGKVLDTEQNPCNKHKTIPTYSKTRLIRPFLTAKLPVCAQAFTK